MVTTTGAVIHIHYCMGKVSSWSFEKKTSDNCNSCGMPIDNAKENSCCKDEIQYYKFNSEQKQAELLSAKLMVSLLATVPPSVKTTTALPLIEKSLSIQNYHVLERAKPQSIYIMYRSILI